MSLVINFFSNILERYLHASLHCALIMNTKSKLLSCYGIFLPSGQFVCDLKNVGSDYHIINCMYIQLTEHKHAQTWCSIAVSWSVVILDFQTSGPCNTDIECCACIVLKHQVLTACIVRKLLSWILFFPGWCWFSVIFKRIFALKIEAKRSFEMSV